MTAGPTVRGEELGQQLPLIVTPPPGPKSLDLGGRIGQLECPAFEARRESRAAASGHGQEPIVYARGRGSNVTDVDGNRYVDLTAGFGALCFGYNDVDVSAAVVAQSHKLSMGLGDVYSADCKAPLLEALAALYPEPGARVILGTSGADAVTAALKTAVLATGKPGVVAFNGSYHGLSHGPLAACGLSTKFRDPFVGQLNEYVKFLDYPRSEHAASVDALRRALAAGDVGAVLIEPMLGRGGCVSLANGFWDAAREACNEAGALLIADEVLTGMGRSGWMLMSASMGKAADVVCVGKALGGGWPISATIGRREVMEAWARHGGSAIHTSTHAGHPSGMAAALEVMSKLSREDWPARNRQLGERWMGLLRRELGDDVRDVVGSGLMVSVRLRGGSDEALRVSRKLLQDGYIALTGGALGDVLTFTPPFTVAEALLESAARALGRIVRPPRGIEGP
jgi:4-aminobutyrate aminotransferase/(S)-3-amino-2-methylpropionate transaminase